MRKKDKKVPGPDFPFIPGKDELLANQRDCNPSKGPLAYATAQHMVMDLGAPKVEIPDRLYLSGAQVVGGQPGSSTSAPASASFTPGWVTKPEKKEEELRITMQPGIKTR